MPARSPSGPLMAPLHVIQLAIKNATAGARPGDPAVRYRMARSPRFAWDVAGLWGRRLARTVSCG